MGRFHPVYIRRSDGMLETATKNGARIQKEANKPTPKQLDDKPKPDGVKDYYREVAIDESKHMDWRRKLAAMLARDIGLDLGVSGQLRHEASKLADDFGREGIHPRPLPRELPTLRARQDRKERRRRTKDKDTCWRRQRATRCLPVRPPSGAQEVLQKSWRLLPTSALAGY